MSNESSSPAESYWLDIVAPEAYICPDSSMATLPFAWSGRTGAVLSMAKFAMTNSETYDPRYGTRVPFTTPCGRPSINAMVTATNSKSPTVGPDSLITVAGPVSLTGGQAEIRYSAPLSMMSTSIEVLPASISPIPSPPIIRWISQERIWEELWGRSSAVGRLGASLQLVRENR